MFTDGQTGADGLRDDGLRSDLWSAVTVEFNSKSYYGYDDDDDYFRKVFKPLKSQIVLLFNLVCTSLLFSCTHKLTCYNFICSSNSHHIMEKTRLIKFYFHLRMSYHEMKECLMVVLKSIWLEILAKPHLLTVSFVDENNKSAGHT